MNTKSLDDNFFIKNAIYCWLHYFGNKDHKWEAIYKELAERDSYTTPEPTPKPTPTPTRKTRVKKAEPEGV